MSTLIDDFPAVKRWLGRWIEQLKTRGEGEDDYRVIADEIRLSADDSSCVESLRRLDDHLRVACDLCTGFDSLIKEKSVLPPDIDEANKTVLNKLSEVRAVVGLARLGFRDIRFAGTPDFTASKDGQQAAIEVTRLGRSQGKRSDVWDYEAGAPDLESLEEVGYHVGLMSSGGNVEDALSEAIYREIEEKYRQIRDAEGADLRMIWISLGRDYLTCNQYELEGMGSFKSMPRTAAKTVALAVQSHGAAGLCELLTHVALCPGRDLQDMLLDTRP